MAVCLSSLLLFVLVQYVTCTSSKTDDMSLQETVASLQKQLINTVQNQDKKISEVTEKVTRLQKTIRQQEIRIAELEKNKQQYEEIIRTLTDFRSEPDTCCQYFINLSLKRTHSKTGRTADDKLKEKLETMEHTPDIGDDKQGLIRKERLLLPTTTPTSSDKLVVFYAYMSKILSSPSTSHTLVFDVVKANLGNGYHSNTGIFIAPRSGYYVLSWTFRQWFEAEHSTELVVNHDVVGRTFLRTQSTDDETVSEMVVVHVPQGADVYVRTHPTRQGYGHIKTDPYGWTSFAGWLLS